MRVLALDSTGAVMTAALVDDDRLIAEHAGDASRALAEQLPGALMTLLDGAGAAPRDVDAFAVASGPGSFTGIRIGMATVQGLATVAGRPVVAVSTLEALAHAAAGLLAPGALVAAWMDARRRQVFTALYRLAGGAPFSDGRIETIEPPAVGDPRATLDRWQRFGTPSLFAVDGSRTHAEFLAGRALVVPASLARTVARVGVERAGAGLAVAPGDLQPIYVRRPDAEIARDTGSVPGGR